MNNKQDMDMLDHDEFEFRVSWKITDKSHHKTRPHPLVYVKIMAAVALHNPKFYQNTRSVETLTCGFQLSLAICTERIMELKLVSIVSLYSETI